MGRTGPVRAEVRRRARDPETSLTRPFARFNVAPRSQAPVIRRHNDGAADLRPDSGPGEASSSHEPATAAPNDIDASNYVNAANAAAAPTTKHESPSDSAQPDPEAPLAVVMQTMRWGLVPHFSKHEARELKTINARSEALVEEPRGLWASIKGRRRCAVPCEGSVRSGTPAFIVGIHWFVRAGTTSG